MTEVSANEIPASHHNEATEGGSGGVLTASVATAGKKRAATGHHNLCTNSNTHEDNITDGPPLVLNSTNVDSANLGLFSYGGAPGCPLYYSNDASEQHQGLSYTSPVLPTSNMAPVPSCWASPSIPSIGNISADVASASGFPLCGMYEARPEMSNAGNHFFSPTGLMDVHSSAQLPGNPHCNPAFFWPVVLDPTSAAANGVTCSGPGGIPDFLKKAVSPYHRRGSMQLWQFLMSLLDDPDQQNLISWTGRPMEFKLHEPEEVARLWGMQKNRPAMNYDKLSRSLRYYYEKGIMQKVSGERYVYKFVCEPEVLMKMAYPEPQQGSNTAGSENNTSESGGPRGSASRTCSQQPAEDSDPPPSRPPRASSDIDLDNGPSRATTSSPQRLHAKLAAIGNVPGSGGYTRDTRLVPCNGEMCSLFPQENVHFNALYPMEYVPSGLASCESSLYPPQHQNVLLPSSSSSSSVPQVRLSPMFAQEHYNNSLGPPQESLDFQQPPFHLSGEVDPNLSSSSTNSSGMSLQFQHNPLLPNQDGAEMIGHNGYRFTSATEPLTEQQQGYPSFYHPDLAMYSQQLLMDSQEEAAASTGVFMDPHPCYSLNSNATAAPVYSSSNGVLVPNFIGEFEAAYSQHVAYAK